MNSKNSIPSKNIYSFPFKKNTLSKIAPAPFHYEEPRMIHAIDFQVAYGTSIHAALDGKVNTIWDGFERGDGDKSRLAKVNVVVLEHTHKEFSVYVHLRKNAPVNLGDSLKQGDILGYTDRTGYCSFPHLHFQVGRVSMQNSIPICFDVGAGLVSILCSPKE